MFERPKKMTVAESDSLAAALFAQGRYKEALDQNDKTRDIIGHDTPELLKNAAACYSMLFMPDRAYHNFTRYMEISGSRSIADVRQHADYAAQAGMLDLAQEITELQVESFEKYHDLAMHAFRHKNYQEAFRMLDKGKRMGNVLWIGQERYDNLPKCPRWSGEDLSGKKVCVVGECGLGDEFIFARWLPDLMKIADVYYYTNNTIKDVLNRNLGVKLRRLEDNFDFWLPSMSLPLALSTYDPVRPSYIKPCDRHVKKWGTRLGSGFCAIAWTGSDQFSQNHFRDIPVEYFVEKLKDKHVLVSVCKAAKAPAGVIDIADEIKSWEDTLAIMSLSKIVVSSCTSTAHAAGSMGIKTYVYTRPDDYFTWSSTKSGSKTEWYENVTVWRTPHIGMWKDTIDLSL